MRVEWGEAHYPESSSIVSFLWSPDSKRGGIDNGIKSESGGRRGTASSPTRFFIAFQSVNLFSPCLASAWVMSPMHGENLFTFIFVLQFMLSSHVCHLAARINELRRLAGRIDETILCKPLVAIDGRRVSGDITDTLMQCDWNHLMDSKSAHLTRTAI